MKKLSVFLFFLICSLVLLSCSNALDESNSITVYDEQEQLTFTFYEFGLEELFLDANSLDVSYHCLTFKVMISNDWDMSYDIPTRLRYLNFTITKDDGWYDRSFMYPDGFDYKFLQIAESYIAAQDSVTGDGTIPLTQNEPISDFGTYGFAFNNNEFYLQINSNYSVTVVSDYEPEYTTNTRETDSCSYSLDVDVSNGLEQIETQSVLCVAYGTDEDNMFTADGFCMIYNFVENMENFQTIEQTENMNLIKVSTSVGNINVYDTEGTLLETWNSWDERSTLESGQYIIRLNVSRTEAHCHISGHSYFILSVS